MVGENDRHTALTPQEFAHLGDGSVAYVKTIRSEDVAVLFPQAPAIQPGLQLFALLGLAALRSDLGTGDQDGIEIPAAGQGHRAGHQ